jgi:hypothetical protein
VWTAAVRSAEPTTAAADARRRDRTGVDGRVAVVLLISVSSVQY